MNEHTTRLIDRLEQSLDQYLNRKISIEVFLSIIAATNTALETSAPHEFLQALKEFEAQVDLSAALLSDVERDEDIYRRFMKIKEIVLRCQDHKKTVN